MGEERHRTPSSGLTGSSEDRVSAFDACEYALLNGMKIVGWENGEVRVEMPAEGKRNVLGTVHGGAIFALADQAFGIAANLEGSTQVALSAGISYLVPARGPMLAAVARCIDENDCSSMYRVRVFDGNRLIALFHGVGYKMVD